MQFFHCCPGIPSHRRKGWPNLSSFAAEGAPNYILRLCIYPNRRPVEEQAVSTPGQEGMLRSTGGWDVGVLQAEFFPLHTTGPSACCASAIAASCPVQYQPAMVIQLWRLSSECTNKGQAVLGVPLFPNRTLPSLPQIGVVLTKHCHNRAHSTRYWRTGKSSMNQFEPTTESPRQAGFLSRLYLPNGAWHMVSVCRVWKLNLNPEAIKLATGIWAIQNY